MRRCAAVYWLIALVLVGVAVGQATAQASLPPTTEDRLRTLEEQNRELLRQVRELTSRYNALTGQQAASAPPGPAAPATNSPGSAKPKQPPGPRRVPPPPPEPPTIESLMPPPGEVREAPLPYSPEQLGRPLPPGRDVVQEGEPALPRARVDLEQGIRLLDPEGRFRIEFHDLTQVEYRSFSPAGNPLTNSFDIPRQRFYFAGQIDKDYDFYSVINRGYGSLDVLDAYMNFRFGPAFNIRVGRTKTPWTYEYYKIAEGDLIAPERSVFVGNLAPNRQIGVMAYGRLFDDELEYALGVFNGPVRSFQDFNNAKDPFLFLDWRPFRNGSNDLVRHLHFVGSGTWGRESHNATLEPNAFRTANDETVSAAVDNVSPTFLKFNPDVRKAGQRAKWAGELVWFYRSLLVLAGYEGGFIGYNTGTRPTTEVPFQGGSFAATFFVTGEEPITRKELEPLRPFNWRNPISEPGAIELYSRTAYLHIGQAVFDHGLASPAIWSREALVLDTGCNWYLNRYLRIFVDWQHSRFGQPVQIAPGRLTHSMNLFWFRTQIFY